VRASQSAGPAKRQAARCEGRRRRRRRRHQLTRWPAGKPEAHHSCWGQFAWRHQQWRQSITMGLGRRNRNWPTILPSARRPTQSRARPAYLAAS